MRCAEQLCHFAADGADDEKMSERGSVIKNKGIGERGTLIIQCKMLPCKFNRGGLFGAHVDLFLCCHFGIRRKIRKTTKKKCDMV